MHTTYIKKYVLAATIVTVFAATTPGRADNASLIISEVAPWSSGDSAVAQDWFEATNIGTSAIDITGWKMDDSSNAFSTAVALKGVTSIAAGQSVIFIEDTSDARTDAQIGTQFVTTWFNGTAPSGLTIGYYGGSGVGLSTSGDAVNLFNASGVHQTGVTFGVSPAGPTFETFDNAQGIDGGISTLSAVGKNGAFVAAGDSNEIGSPGVIANPVPEPSAGLALIGGLATLVGLRRRRNA